ncbi:MAG: TIGR03089 family protein [Nocardioidaceae bacterium]
MPPSTVLAALTDALRRDPGRPLLTFYDDATGERIELSVATFDNWVSKVANLLDSELELGPGDLFAIELPPHWQVPVLVMGGWAAGLALSTTDGPVQLCVVGPSALTSDGVREADRVLACSLRPLGGRFAEALPVGWLDFAVEVPPQPDELLVAQPPTSDEVAIVSAAGLDTHADVAAAGLDLAHRIGLEPGGRLLTDHDPADAAGILTTLVAPLMVGASVVLVAPTTAERRTAIAAQERATTFQWQAPG